MLQVLLFSLITSTSAFTTHRYDAYDLGNYRPNVPYLDNNFEYANGHGRRPVQMYEYPKRYDGVVFSDVFEGPVINSDGDRRRVDTYNYQNPYQWNRQVPWNRVGVTEPTRLYNRFENSNQGTAVNNPDTNNRQPTVQQDKENVTNQMYGIQKINETQEFVDVPHISTQSDDVNRSLIINEQRITWNNDHQSPSKDNDNITARSINADNYSNSLNVPSEQTTDKVKKTNNKPVNNTDDNRNQPNNYENRNTNDDTKYGTKTTQDNEVTPRTYEQRTKAYEDDRWVWSNGEDQPVETTTLFDLGDRAAFAGDGCPTGKIKLGDICVAKD